MGKQLTEYALYRWRYALGYGLIATIVVGLLVIAGLFIPGGLSQAEIQSVISSSSISFSLSSFQPDSIINLPYHLLQRASIGLFGMSNLSIKLPSLMLGALSVFGMFILLRAWFRQNVAVLTALIVITTGQFLFVAQSGTPSIVYIFWSVWLLVAALMISRRATHTILWKVTLFGIAALSIYTPLSIYILIALASAIVLHPHLRYLVRRLSMVKLAFGFFIALVLVTPLTYAVVKQPSVGLSLLGMPDEPIDLKANILQLLRQYFNFISPSSGVIMTPIYSLGSVILIALGIARLVTTKYTARSYIITAWILLLTPVILINPGYISITFVPVMLLMAMGINMLLSSWYRLFPRNPYARLAGLLPLTVLMGGLVLSGVGRYMYGYTYDPQTAGNFSHDLRMLNSQLAELKGQPVAIVTSQEELPFYTIFSRHTTGVTAVATRAAATAPTVIVTHDAHGTFTVNPYRIVTDSTRDNADRFYIYKTGQK